MIDKYCNNYSKFINTLRDNLKKSNSYTKYDSIPTRLIINTDRDDKYINSYGIIAVIKSKDTIIVKKHNTQAYDELMRGLYNNGQLYNIILNLSDEERERILNHTFEELWNDFFIYDVKEINMEVYNWSKFKFEKLKDCFEAIFKEFPSEDPKGIKSWSFPKGRSSSKDKNDISSAIREFQEETFIDLDNIKYTLLDKPLTASWYATNNRWYKCYYYIMLIDEDLSDKCFDSDDIEINKEVYHESSIRTFYNSEVYKTKIIKLEDIEKYDLKIKYEDIIAELGRI